MFIGNDQVSFPCPVNFIPFFHPGDYCVDGTVLFLLGTRVL